jgi:hypothetical protein
MGKYFWLLLLTGKMFALEIHQVDLSAVSNQALNVSLTTQGEELYYFHSAQHTMLSNDIVLEVYFVEGFGSTMDYLNNNFTLPILTTTAATYTLIIKAYYIDPANGNLDLQDEMHGIFTAPLSGTVPLETKTAPLTFVFYPNPTDGDLYIPKNIESIALYDAIGRKLQTIYKPNGKASLQHLADGMYYLIAQEKPTRVVKIILQK